MKKVIIIVVAALVALAVLQWCVMSKSADDDNIDLNFDINHSRIPDSLQTDSTFEPDSL